MEKKLLKISVITSILGILILTAYTFLTSVESSFELSGEGDELEISGKISLISERGNTTFLEIKPTSNINAILFNKGFYELKEGKFSELKGKIEVYKGEKEIIVEDL